MPLSSLAVAGGISAGGSLLSGLLGGKSANAAAQRQQQAAQTAVQGVGSAVTGYNNAAGSAATGVQQGAGQASQAVQQGSTQANSLLSLLNTTQQAQLSPYLQAGGAGANALTAALAPGGALANTFAPPSQQSVSSTPEYQFQLQQGLQALQQSAASVGGLQGGGTLKGITQYGQGLASTAYQQAYNNAANTFQLNRNSTLSALSLATGVGNSALGQSNQVALATGLPQGSNITQAANYTGNSTQNAAEYSGNASLQAAQAGLTGAQLSGQYLTNAGNAQAAGILGQSTAYQGALGGVTNAASGYATQAGLYNAGYSPFGGYSTGSFGQGSYNAGNPANITYGGNGGALPPSLLGISS